MSVLYVLIMDGSVILFWVRTWCIFFSTTVKWLDVGPTGYWLLEFWNISFCTSVKNSDVEPTGSWWFGYGPPGSWLMLVLVSLSLLLILLWPRYTSINISSMITRFRVAGNTWPISTTSTIALGRVAGILRHLSNNFMITWRKVAGLSRPMYKTLLTQRHFNNIFFGNFPVIFTMKWGRMAGIRIPIS